MFKNANIYRISNAPNGFKSAQDHHSVLMEQAFTPCGATQVKSMGWVPPRGHEHGALLESIGGQYILKLMTETKAVPGQALKREVERMCAEIERSTGRKPGKKERRDIKEDALMAMLPGAFPKQYATLIWLDPVNDLLVVDASSHSKADDAITMLIKSFGGISMQLINTQTSPAAAMAHWLREREAPENFTIDRECELKACDESKAVVKYGRHALDTNEVVQHITQGKMPTKLAMTYSDRVSFVLTEAMTLKKVEFLDVAMEENFQNKNGIGDAFDADVAIVTGELSKLIPALISVLGGEVEMQEGGAA